MLGVVFLFLSFALGLLRRNDHMKNIANGETLDLFVLVAGLMLFETKAVTELSLLFGSTWIVNAVVITAFLVMGLLANTLMMFRGGSGRLAYAALLALLAIDVFLPYSWFGALSPGARTFATAT